MKKIRIGILFGGQSGEHEISILSARNVVEALDKEKYEVQLIGISKKGEWVQAKLGASRVGEGGPKSLRLEAASQGSLTLMPGTGDLVYATPEGKEAHLDVVLPILHGPMGEDGTVQGLLKLANLPFVGSDVLGSAACMDKITTKRLLRGEGISVGVFWPVEFAHVSCPSYEEASKRLGAVIFVKPSNMGSSVGVSKARNKEEFEAAIELAKQYDTRLILEAFTPGREIEIAVLGNENPQVSVLGEIVPHEDFYSYAAKYELKEGDGADLVVPAPLPDHVREKIEAVAKDSFRILNCAGLARVDFFVTPNEEVIVNEVNTFPGFTNISMYPRLWAASGIPYAELIDRLIQLALERHQRRAKGL
jgi:D-alanine-D-alanine ligase